MNAPISPGSGLAPAMALHRARHLAVLCQGRAVHLAGQTDNASRQAIAATATLVDSSAELVLSLAAQTPAAILAGLSALVARCDAKGVLVLSEALTDGAAAGDPTLRAALASRFRTVATLVQRPLAASAILPAQQAGLRILPLSAPPAADPVCLIHLCSDGPVSLPGPALHELGAGFTPPPLQPALMASVPLALPAAGLAAALAGLRSRTVALAERLDRQSRAMIDQDAEIERLRRSGGTTLQPRTLADLRAERHDWPLADNPGATPDRLGVYERRPDDPVMLESRAGDAFLQHHALLDAAPDLAGAIAAINTLRPRQPPAPAVSVVIPVHGQLGYTLNCLHSLATLPDRTGFEIILIDDASPDGSAVHLAGIHGLHLLAQTENRGFLASCNLAAEQARGRFVLFLNNDTRVVPGWLDALVESFTRFPRAGLVGSKLLYPDGRLQEAGGIIWRDGSAWNDGRDDDPNRPGYCVARQVDYISGCSIMLPTALWRSLGGFDRLFTPAYCEDADLALRVRAAGHEVWYQPLSGVVHYEGRTSGTDLTRGVKAYQVVNARKLYLRWRDALAGHRPNGEAPLRERERHVQRRALVIDATAPTPRQDAGSVTAIITMQLFQRLGYKVHYVPQDNFLYQPQHIAPLQAQGIEAAYAPYDIGFSQYIRAHGAQFDVVLVFRVTILERVIEDLRRHAPQAPILFHNMDLHFLRMERQAEADNDDLARKEAADMRARELDLIGQVDTTITHSTYERDLLATLAPTAPVVVWPFMFPFHGTDVPFAPRHDFCFLGGYTHAPNIDAVVFMAHEVMPLIWRHEPDARFIIAGANPGPEVKALASARIVVTGQIEDLRDVFDAARVFVCPLRIGAGTKGKVSTAMAYGMPVVTTTCGAEGMDLSDGQEVLIADTAADFAAACLRVYRSAALWRRLSKAGQRLVQDKHSLQTGQTILTTAIETALLHKLGLAEGAMG